MSYKRIVVGTDGSQTASRAAEKALALAKSEGAKLEVVSAFDPVSSGDLERLREEVSDPELRHILTPSSGAEQLTNDMVEKAKSEGVEGTAWVQGGDAAGLLIDVAEETDADLIVVGNRGMAGMKRFLLGSVSNKVSHHAPCDVLIVRTDY